MRITLIDDSIAFDGRTPGLRPLGGPEKAFAGLASALARRGHEVSVFNRTTEPSETDGAVWMPLDAPRPDKTDVLIAFRKPSLLGEQAAGRRKILWLASHAKYLGKPGNQKLLDKHSPTLVFQGRAHKNTFDAWKSIRQAIIPPGVGDDFSQAVDGKAAEPPIALVTTHPLHGLARMLELWTAKIHPVLPEAKLVICSMALAIANDGGALDETLKPIFEKVKLLAGQGVEVRRPGSDPEMAELYRQTRVHLYPKIDNEVYCWTLGESQAAGCPAIGWRSDVTAERIRNGQTGFLAPDWEAFGNLVTTMMRQPGMYENAARDARMLQRGRTWDVAAAEFEALWG